MKSYFLHYEKLPKWKDPEEIFTGLYENENHTFWLDSSKVEKNLSRFSYMGKANEIINYSLASKSKDIFSYLNEELKKITVEKEINFPFDFTGGFVGYFGYELKALCGFNKVYNSNYPDSLWYFVKEFIAFDHLTDEVYLVCLDENVENAKQWFQDIKNKIQSITQIEKISVRKTKDLKFNLDRSEEEYLKDINSCKKYLKDGDSYEICLTNKITLDLDHPINSLNLYRALRKINPAPYAAYIKHKDFSVLCSSPERFLKIDKEGLVESKPIKGTIKRSKDKNEDTALAKELQTSEKNKAENLMIVDLVRNDLGRVCETGSIKVSKLMEIETYETVHQLVSTIRGNLKKNVSVVDCIKACFPGGSMTGAPKKRTLEIIDKLEKKARGVYSGALGFLSTNGTVDLNIVIRTIVVNKDQLSIGAGGAIVSESNGEKEFEEMMLKAEALMESINCSISAISNYTGANFAVK